MTMIGCETELEAKAEALQIHLHHKAADDEMKMKQTNPENMKMATKIPEQSYVHH
jgi:hypothetical protein